MNKELSVEEKKSQTIVENTMGDITRATRKVLMDYVSKMYVTSFAKVIAYLGLESEDAISLMNAMDSETRHQVTAFAKDYQKTDIQVISEVEHIITASGMDFTEDYKIIKENISLSEKTFVEEAVHKFQTETPIFPKKLEDCLFSFEDFQYLDDRAIQLIIRETDQVTQAKALKGASSKVQERFFQNMTQRAATMLKEDMEWMGPIRTKDVAEAQSSLVQTVFHLSDKGDIVISTKEEIIDFDL